MANFDSFAKLFPVNLPAFDPAALTSAQARNTDAAFKVFDVMSKTVQAIAQRQNELLQTNLAHTADLTKAILGAKDPSDVLNQQIAFAKESTEKAAAQARELSEIAAKGSNEAIAILRKRAEESVAEANLFANGANAGAGTAKKAA